MPVTSRRRTLTVQAPRGPGRVIEFGVMQDRYVGDIGDFGKYALLNAFAGDDLRLGVHWYLNTDEEGNTDGKFTEYRHLSSCDPPLFEALQNLVRDGRRSVAEVERARILPANTLFYSLPFSSRDSFGRASRRAAWNARALEVLAEADLVFMDPDNGLTRRPASLMGAAAAKYVSPEEVGPYFRRGNSLIIYHHQTREKGGLAVTISEKFALLRSLGCERPWAFVFRRTSVRVYFLMPAPGHISILEKRSYEFLDTSWGAPDTLNSNSQTADEPIDRDEPSATLQVISPCH